MKHLSGKNSKLIQVDERTKIAEVSVVGSPLPPLISIIFVKKILFERKQRLRPNMRPLQN